MSAKQAQALMAVVILTRSSAYIFSKTGLETLGTFNLLAARFLLAFLVLGVIFFKRAKSLADFFDTLRGSSQMLLPLTFLSSTQGRLHRLRTG